MRSLEVVNRIKDFVAVKSLKLANLTAIGNHANLHQESMLELQDCGVSLQLSAGNQSSKRLEAETASLQSLACFKTMMEEQNSLILSRANIRMSQGIDAGRN